MPLWPRSFTFSAICVSNTPECARPMRTKLWWVLSTGEVKDTNDQSGSVPPPDCSSPERLIIRDIRGKKVSFLNPIVFESIHSQLLTRDGPTSLFGGPCNDSRTVSSRLHRLQDVEAESA